MNELTVGRLLSETWHTARRGFGPFATIAFLVHLPYLVVWLVLFALGAINPASEAALNLADGVVLGPITSAALVYGVFELLRGGRRVAMRDCLRVGMRRWPSVLGASILVGIAVVGGMCLLVLPGVIAFVGLAVTIPVLVVEDSNVSDALRRSWDLTTGYRLRIFLLYLVLFALVFGVFIVFMGGVGILFWDTAEEPASTDLTPGENLSATLLGFVFLVLFAVLQAVASMVIYYELRRVKEGVGTEELAAAFD